MVDKSKAVKLLFTKNDHGQERMNILKLLVFRSTLSIPQLIMTQNSLFESRIETYLIFQVFQNTAIENSSNNETGVIVNFQ